MAEYSFCESAVAGPRAPWHIRQLTKVGRKPHGGIDTVSLCGRVQKGWDLEVDMTDFHLAKNTCKGCLKAYRETACSTP
jgi:hypothetical protein